MKRRAFFAAMLGAPTVKPNGFTLKDKIAGETEDVDADLRNGVLFIDPTRVDFDELANVNLEPGMIIPCLKPHNGKMSDIMHLVKCPARVLPKPL